MLLHTGRKKTKVNKKLNYHTNLMGFIPFSVKLVIMSINI